MSVDIQLQMKRNMEEMHSALDELVAWTGDIGKKDRSLRGMEPEMSSQKQSGASDDEEEAREIAEVRAELSQMIARDAQQKADARAHDNAGTAEAAPAGDSSMVESAARGANQRSRADQYRAWETYDADAEVNLIDARQRQQEELRAKVTRLENQRAQARVRRREARNAAEAEALRARGNTAFSAAQYEEAVEAYTAALELTPRAAVLYANRALALLRVRLPASAEEDCSAALEIDLQHVKALLRRAQARIELSNYDGALEDLEGALLLEPRNAAARRQMHECRQLRARALPRPPLPTVLVAIAHVQHDADNDSDPFVASLGLQAPAAVPAAVLIPPATGAAADADAVEEATTTATAAAATTAAPRVMLSPMMRAASFPLPSTAADVERAWRSLRRSAADWAEYVRRLEPNQLRALFKHNLPAELLTAFLLALDETFFPVDAPRALAVLHALCHAGRFSILTMYVCNGELCSLLGAVII
uniref:RNA polymerase II-associated protein 3 n=1 Tax=Calcidiscus leptoporus TaxID=127549 RepID=A0A7S0NNH2_9EUKA